MATCPDGNVTMFYSILTLHLQANETQAEKSRAELTDSRVHRAISGRYVGCPDLSFNTRGLDPTKAQCDTNIFIIPHGVDLGLLMVQDLGGGCQVPDPAEDHTIPQLERESCSLPCFQPVINSHSVLWHIDAPTADQNRVATGTAHTSGALKRLITILAMTMVLRRRE